MVVVVYDKRVGNFCRHSKIKELFNRNYVTTNAVENVLRRTSLTKKLDADMFRNRTRLYPRSPNQIDQVRKANLGVLTKTKFNQPGVQRTRSGQHNDGITSATTPNTTTTPAPPPSLRHLKARNGRRPAPQETTLNPSPANGAASLPELLGLDGR